MSKARHLFTGTQGQLLYAQACISCGLYAQAERHLRMAMGCANLTHKDLLSPIMIALSAIRQAGK